ncbi:MAG: hypothetical protein AAGH70_14325 [Pseudomonadota bacterium]
MNETAQSRATAMGLTAQKAPFSAADADDPRRLLRALSLLPLALLLLWLVSLAPLAILAALPALVLTARLAWPARRYFVAFSPRNAFPRNLPALARWAALYSGAMLVMIVLPPMGGPLRWAIWLCLLGACLAVPLLKAWLRARRVWGPADDT